MALVVVGSCNVDLITYVDRWPAPGETIMGAGFSRGWGGKGANQAVMGARLLEKANCKAVTMIGAVGDDAFGSEYRAALVEEGVVPLLKVITGVPTGVAPILVHTGNGNNEIVVVPGANACIEPAQLTTADAHSAIGCASVLLAQLEVTPAATLAALRAAQAAGALSILTPAPVPLDGLSPSLCAATDLLMPNRTEALLLADAARRRSTRASHAPATSTSASASASGSAAAAAAASATEAAAAAVGGGDESSVPMSTLLRAASEMLQSGVGAVCITCGASGALIAVNEAAFSAEGRRRRMMIAAAAAEAASSVDTDHKGEVLPLPVVDEADVHAAIAAAVFVPSVKPPCVVDTTGAGDAFAGSCGYFLAAQRQREREREREGRSAKDADADADADVHACKLTLSQLQDACRRAAVVAADSVTRKGTQMSYPRRADLPSFLFHRDAPGPSTAEHRDEAGASAGASASASAGASAGASAAAAAAIASHWCAALPEAVPAVSIHTL